MTDTTDTNPDTANQLVPDLGRSEEFKQYRAMLVDCCVDFMEQLKQIRTLDKKLVNGMTIEDWPKSVSSDTNLTGYTKKFITDDETTGAIIKREPGTSYFEMAEVRPDGVRHFLALQVDKIEALFGEVNPNGVPKMITSIYEEFTDKDGSIRYFGVDVMTDGSVRLKEVNSAENLSKSLTATQADELQGLPEMVASIMGDTVGD